MERLQQKQPTRLLPTFFDRMPDLVAQSLLGKVVAVRQGDVWLKARIIETEAYYLHEKASHSSLGYTEKRKALFMSPGTIYMYYARGGDSLNFSCKGEGNAVLIKSGFPISQQTGTSIKIMQQNNPRKDGSPRDRGNLCGGQTLLCRSLGLKVPEWDAQQLTPGKLELWDDAYRPKKIIQTTRLGIPAMRDAHLHLRFIDHAFSDHCTKNPLRVRNFHIDRDYTILKP